MRIGYFGGSFDPPHRGHLAVARAAAAAFGLEQILFVPTGHQPLKRSGPVASYEDRLAMVRLLCATAAADEVSLGTSFQASALEAPLPDGEPNYTVDTLTLLRAALSVEDRLFVLLGADAFLQLPEWRSPEKLLTLADWIIVSRPGFDLTRFDQLPFTPGQRDRIHLLPTLADPTSATLLRHALEDRPVPRVLESLRVIADGLPASVLAYIREHHLYNSERVATIAAG